MGPSKIWWHIIDNDAVPQDLEHLEHAVGFKVVGDDNVWKRVQFLTARYPGKPIVVRLINHEGNARPQTPIEAIAFLDRYISTYNLRHVYFQTFRNMPAVVDAADWDAAMLRLARPLRIQLVTGDFPMGYPGVGRFAQPNNPDQFPRYYGAFKELSISGPELALFGWQLYMRGNGELKMGEDWLSLPLRYRELLKSHLVPSGWGNVGILGTEGGIDGPNMEQAHIGPEAAAEALIAVDGEWMKDSNLVGVALYTLDNSLEAQRGFNMRGTLFNLIDAYQANLPAAPIVEVPPIGPQPRRTVTTDRLNIRMSPHAVPDDNKVGQLRADTPVEVLDNRDGWSKIALFVKSEFIKGA